MYDGGRFRRLLVGMGADVSASAAALTHALELALAYRAKLTVYVFAPDLLQPFPLTFGSSSVWIAEEKDRDRIGIRTRHAYSYLKRSDCT